MTSPNATSTTTATQSGDDQNKSSKQQLLQKLEKQLIYYFSTNNLSKDVYLQTIMNLNSGHVPISILANFSNVNKIIGRSGTLLQYHNNSNHVEDGIHNDHKEDGGKRGEEEEETGNDSKGKHSLVEESANNGATDGTHEEEEEEAIAKKDVSSDRKSSIPVSAIDDYTTQIYDLLRQSAQQSNLLSVVSLNQYGNVVDEDSKNQQNQQDAATRIRTIVAIGPSGLFNGIVPEEYALEKGDNDVVSDSTRFTRSKQQKPSTRHSSGISGIGIGSSNHNDGSNKSNIIILRDVHSDATENDIRQLFEEEQILSVNKEIGNCW